MAIEKRKIYIAWSNKQDSYSFNATLKAVEAAGCIPVILPMLRSKDLPYEGDALIGAVDEHGTLLPQYAELIKTHTWHHADLTILPPGLDCVIFPGGDDISPSLCSPAQLWHGVEGDTEYSAIRDVSDYLLMSYCLDHDIPVFAICRGMQLLSMVSGAKMIGDIPTYNATHGLLSNVSHRDPRKVVFAAHDIRVIDKNSLLYRCTGKEVLFKVPSWHHQGVASIEGAALTVTAIADDNLIEAVEDPRKRFALGVQFHPEVAVRKWVEHSWDASKFTDYDTAVSFIYALDKARREI